MFFFLQRFVSFHHFLQIIASIKFYCYKVLSSQRYDMEEGGGGWELGITAL